MNTVAAIAPKNKHTHSLARLNRLMIQTLPWTNWQDVFCLCTFEVQISTIYTTQKWRCNHQLHITHQYLKCVRKLQHCRGAREEKEIWVNGSQNFGKVNAAKECNCKWLAQYEKKPQKDLGPCVFLWNRWNEVRPTRNDPTAGQSVICPWRLRGSCAWI